MRLVREGLGSRSRSRTNCLGLVIVSRALIYITLDSRLEELLLMPFERWAKIEVVVCLMRAVDVLSRF